MTASSASLDSSSSSNKPVSRLSSTTTTTTPTPTVAVASTQKESYKISILQKVWLVFCAVVVAVYLWRSLPISPLSFQICYGSFECVNKLDVSWAGLPVDHSDHQWTMFRGQIPILAGFALVWAAVSAAARNASLRSNDYTPRLYFYLFGSLIFATVLHLATVVWLVAFLLINYLILVSLRGTRLLAPVTWIYNVVTLLYADQLFGVLLFSNLHESLEFLDLTFVRWPTVYRMAILRMISFNLDAHWAYLQAQASGKLQAHRGAADDDKPLADDDVERVEIDGDDEQYKRWERRSQPVHLYNLGFYLSYTLYAPLIIAGPIISANAFMAQVQYHRWRISGAYLALYVVRWLTYVAVLELGIHYMLVFAGIKSGAFAEAIQNYLSISEIMYYGWMCVQLMWFKFLVIWRFFRLWSLLENIEVPENMNGCINCNYTVRGFWRIWHYSFNRWLVRYIYSPLGGRSYYILGVFLVFTFTAMWHDTSLHLFTWGWLMVLAVIPEYFVSSICSRSDMAWFRATWYYPHLEALAGATNVIFLVAVNLIGFNLGVEGIGAAIREMIFQADDTIYCVLHTLFFLSCGVHVVMEIDRWKARKALARKREREARGIK